MSDPKPTTCYCCTCPDEGSGHDPYCRNHGHAGVRVCTKHESNDPGQGKDEDGDPIATVQEVLAIGAGCGNVADNRLRERALDTSAIRALVYEWNEARMSSTAVAGQVPALIRAVESLRQELRAVTKERDALKDRRHWPDCAINHGGVACDMGPQCGSVRQ